MDLIADVTLSSVQPLEERFSLQEDLLGGDGDGKSYLLLETCVLQDLNWPDMT